MLLQKIQEIFFLLNSLVKNLSSEDRRRFVFIQYISAKFDIVLELYTQKSYSNSI
jgi:hypothetical protein